MHKLVMMLVATAACGFGSKSYGDQVEMIADSDGAKWAGKLDAELSPMGQRGSALSPEQPAINTEELAWARISDGKVCFQLWQRYSFNPSRRNREDAEVERRLQTARLVPIVVTAYDKLDKKTGWPAKRNDVLSVDLTAQKLDTKHDRDQFGNIKGTYHWLATKIRICAKGPTVTPTTRYIAVTRFFENPFLYIFEVDGPIRPEVIASVNEGEGDAAADADAEDPDADTAPPATEVAPPEARAKGAIIDALRASGEYPMFLALVDTSGIDLDGQKVTVFAPTDAAFKRLPGGVYESWGKTPEDALKRVQRYVVEGVHGADALRGEPKLRSLDDKTVKVRLKKDVLMIKNATITTPGTTVPGGQIYSVDRTF